ncbi:MAG: MFS transporter [Haloarculaceae archaeon]
MSADRSPGGRLAARLAPLRGGGRGWVLLTVAAGWFATLGLRFVVPALLPRIKDTFGVNNAGAGLAVTVIWITYAGTQLPAGAMVDRLGERTLLTASLVVAGSSLVLFGLVPAFGLFLVAAGLFGLGTGLYGPARGMVLSRTFRDNDGAAFGATLAAGSVGAAALPFLATTAALWADGRIAGLPGWQLALASFAPLFAVLAVAVWRTVPGRGETRPATEARDARTETDGGAAAASVLSTATSREVVVAAAGAMFMLFTFQGLTAFYTTYLVEVKGLSATVAGGLFALLFLAGAVFQSSAGRAADLYGHRRVLVAIGVGSLPPLALLPLVDGRLALAVLTVPIGLRLAMGPVVNAYVVGVIPSEIQGTTWGLVRTTFFTVGSLGSVAVGTVADAARFNLAVYGLAALTIPAIAAFAVLPDREG